MNRVVGSQEYIELVRQDRRLEAVKHAKKFFSNYEEGQLPEIQQCMGMLAFNPDTGTAYTNILHSIFSFTLYIILCINELE